MATDAGRVGDADRVLSPSATEPVPVSAHSGNAPSREAIEDWLVENCGRGLPYVTATDLPTALHGLAYTLRQIELSRTYRPHIGQQGPAASAIRWALEYIAAREMPRDSDEQPQAEDPKGLDHE